MADMAELKRRPHDSGEDALLVPTGAPLYESLSARLIAYDRLVSTLGRGGYSGYVRVLGPGVLMLRQGDLDGAFTTHSRELSTDEKEVLALASDPEARIEVRSATDQAPLHHAHHAEAREEVPAVS